MKSKKAFFPIFFAKYLSQSSQFEQQKINFFHFLLKSTYHDTLKVALNLLTLTFHLNTGQIQRLCCLALILASSWLCLSHAKSDYGALRMKDYYGISQKFLVQRMSWAANFKKIVRV